MRAGARVAWAVLDSDCEVAADAVLEGAGDAAALDDPDLVTLVGRGLGRRPRGPPGAGKPPRARLDRLIPTRSRRDGPVGGFSSLSPMSSRWRRYLTEAVRFLAVGGLATLVALVLFNLLVHGFGAERLALLESEPILAYVLANTVGMAVSFHGSRNYAFKDRSVRPADGGLSAFVVINAVTMLLPIACLTISREVLGLADPVSDNIAANVIGLVLGMTARFFAVPHLRLPPPAAAAGRGALGQSCGAVHRCVHECPSWASSSLSSGRLTPTTLWWSPSMPVMNAPPEAVDGEGAGDVQRLAGRDVRRDLLVAHVGEVHGGRGGRRGGAPGGGVAQAVTGAQHAAASAHRLPAAGGLRGVRGLAERLAVELEHRVAAEHHRAGRHVVALGDGRALQLGEAAAPGRRAARPSSWDSSTPETITTGSTPALRRVARRAGEAEARTRVLTDRRLLGGLAERGTGELGERGLGIGVLGGADREQDVDQHPARHEVADLLLAPPAAAQSLVDAAETRRGPRSRCGARVPRRSRAWPPAAGPGRGSARCTPR